MNHIKLSVLGSKGAGKSALIVRFLTGRFIGEYASTSECIYNKQVTVDGKTTNVEIYDPCTQPIKQNPPLSEELSRADGFLVVYDISHRSTFIFAKTLICSLRDSQFKTCKRDTEAVVFLIGNKQDLCHVREVALEEGQVAALEYRCQFFELSAAEQYQEVADMFTSIMRKIVHNIKIKEKQRPSGSKSMAKLINNVFGKRRKSV
ncbi:ras-related and estrogen-regulated growth inhibitor-like protein isoform X1 [Bufo bufo]|uniref:ras-related and estrogen-regulated growth inhibitor-like protein isoform X1 n=1 Tax=Bufo bufo TaxID=8384 RepID=UPI001ABDAC02|nr:ras-related and estrogen-regulated growth inhibitor-like protein isoform X1 [Bufo bufo]